MRRYRHKPIVVKAARWTGRDETLRLLKTNGLRNHKAGWFPGDGNLYELIIMVKGHPTTVGIGDYVIKYVDGTFNMSTKEHFEEFFDEISI